MAVKVPRYICILNITSWYKPCIYALYILIYALYTVMGLYLEELIYGGHMYGRHLMLVIMYIVWGRGLICTMYNMSARAVSDTNRVNRGTRMM